MPRDFGLIGMVAIFIALSQTIVDSGLSNALIREKHSSQADYSSTFYFNFIISVIIYSILYITAVPISRFFNEPLLVSILRVISLVIIINSFGIIQRTILKKNIDYKTQTLIDTLSTAISGAVAIIAAFYGLGVWSLVIKMLLMQSIQAALLMLYNRWMPSLVFNIESFKRLYKFGWKLLLSGIIHTLYDNIYFAIIGKYFSTVMLGFFANSKRLVDISSQSITVPVMRVSYPVLSIMQDDGNILIKGYRKLMKNTVFLNFPLMTGLLVIAPSFIRFIFGEKWIPSIPYFQVLCLTGLLYPLHAINLNILKVKGRSDLFLKLEILKKVIGLLSIAVALYLRLGVMGLLWAGFINSIIAYLLNSVYSAELLSYPAIEQFRDIMPLLFISAIMGSITYFIGTLLPDIDLLKLIIQVITGLISYITICLIFKIEELNILQNLKVLRKNNSPVSK